MLTVVVAVNILPSGLNPLPLSSYKYHDIDTEIDSLGLPSLPVDDQQHET